VGTAYREVVVLLGRLYLNHVQVSRPGVEVVGHFEEGMATASNRKQLPGVSGVRT
jgi:hypothetical protein